MSENKHKHLYLNFLIYLIFSHNFNFFIFKVYFSKQKTLIVLFPGVLELLILKVFNFRSSKTIGIFFYKFLSYISRR